LREIGQSVFVRLGGRDKLHAAITS
jgi:hypothetical protein